MRKNKPLNPTNVPVDRDKRDVWIQILTYLILSVLVFWFLQKFCRYDYTYDEQFRMFRYSWNYAEPLLFSAGGISTYIADYLTQFYYWPVCGALINTLFFLGTALGVFFILRKLIPDYLTSFFAVLCGLVIVVLETDLNYQTENTLSILLILLALNFILYAPNKAISSVVFMVSTVVVGYITGHFLYVFILGLVAFLFYVFGMEKFTRKFRSKITPQNFVLRQVISVILCICALWLGLNFFTQRHHNQSTRLKCLETLRWRKDWDGILALPYMKLSPTTLYAAYQNLALANKGVLGEQFDKYPQLGVEGLWSDNHGMQYELLLFSDIYFVQGNVAASQMMAFNGFYYSGKTVLPTALLRLVETNLINGSYQVAEKYISILEETLLYKKPASEYRKFLNHPELIEQDPVLGPLKKITQGLDGLSSDMVTDLKKIVQANPDFKAAKDYLDCYTKLSHE
ncbi:MAG: hypothetical protein IKH95_08070 [Bacteroidaceae bacterium]|nr:hypothetical protein [Bacteroidaceae bacterium]